MREKSSFPVKWAKNWRQVCRRTTHGCKCRVTGITRRTESVPLHPLLASQLDRGEAAVIQTALDESIPTVILDERKARRLAIAMGLKVTGTLGIVLLAKQRGVLPSVRAAIHALRQHGIWLEAALETRVISLSGE